jgi:hypothetical protein
MVAPNPGLADQLRKEGYALDTTNYRDWSNSEQTRINALTTKKGHMKNKRSHAQVLADERRHLRQSGFPWNYPVHRNAHTGRFNDMADASMGGTGMSAGVSGGTIALGALGLAALGGAAWYFLSGPGSSGSAPTTNVLSGAPTPALAPAAPRAPAASGALPAMAPLAPAVLAPAVPATPVTATQPGTGAKVRVPRVPTPAQASGGASGGQGWQEGAQSAAQQAQDQADWNASSAASAAAATAAGPDVASDNYGAQYSAANTGSTYSTVGTPLDPAVQAATAAAADASSSDSGGVLGTLSGVLGVL